MLFHELHSAGRRRCQENLEGQAERRWAWIRFSSFPPCLGPSARTSGVAGLAGALPSCSGNERVAGIRSRQPAILHKEYSTPAGKLRPVFASPTTGRTVITSPCGRLPGATRPQASVHRRGGELEALRSWLTPPHPDDVAQYKAEAERATSSRGNRAFCWQAAGCGRGYGGLVLRV